MEDRLEDFEGVISFLKETDRPILLSCSGGKDSTACGLLLRDHGIPFQPVFCDTGWEHDLTYQYLNETLEPLFGKIERLIATWEGAPEDAPAGMEQRILKWNLFPSGVVRWCTNDLKLAPFREYCVKVFLQTGKLPINITGVRRGESQKRATYPYAELQDEALQVRPLLEWSEDMVIDFHKSHNVMPNPLYLKGASRVGCWPCIFANKSDIRTLNQIDPARIDHIESLEKRVQEARGDGKGTFFKKGTIREAVSWANGKHDGMQSLFTDEDFDYNEVGCFRWGLCEQQKDDPKS
jgi:3'-phosphoadenosine 5'-phosphosulfate sulfotransferase (PAPS reductase)/FAD synthetase